jgi:choline dehydrogenase-like flavoprotein
LSKAFERQALSVFVDARTVPNGTILTPDIAIVGGGPAGITLALALADARVNVALFESGGMDFDPATQDLYAGTLSGVSYVALSGSRLRYLGGSTNHWGGWCRPLDPIDFEKRDWLAHSGWPITRQTLEPYFPRAQTLVEAGPFIYDDEEKWTGALGQKTLELAKGGVYTSWFQFSKTRDSILPTHFGQRYVDDLKRVPRLTLYFQANVTGLRLAQDASHLDHLDVGTLSGHRFTVRPKFTVVATGAMENARLLLASNDVMPAGIGNAYDRVGRFFADHPIPRDTATLVIFDGALAEYYLNFTNANGAVVRATFAPREVYQRAEGVLGSLTTVEDRVNLDELGTAAVTATAAALGVDASNAKAYSLGCGLELAPDPDRRLTLTAERDALGIPKLNLNMSISDSDFAHYRQTMKELGRQLLAARTGMIRLNRTQRSEWLSVIDWGNHHMGTTRMSDSPKKGVVDANLAVFGVPNLFVAGSSSFPTYGASNPTLNLVALTLRLADHLKALLR